MRPGPPPNDQHGFRIRAEPRWPFEPWPGRDESTDARSARCVGSSVRSLSRVRNRTRRVSSFSIRTRGARMSQSQSFMQRLRIARRTSKVRLTVASLTPSARRESLTRSDDVERSSASGKRETVLVLVGAVPENGPYGNVIMRKPSRSQWPCRAGPVRPYYYRLVNNDGVTKARRRQPP